MTISATVKPFPVDYLEAAELDLAGLTPNARYKVAILNPDGTPLDFPVLADSEGKAHLPYVAQAKGVPTIEVFTVPTPEVCSVIPTAAPETDAPPAVVPAETPVAATPDDGVKV